MKPFIRIFAYISFCTIPLFAILSVSYLYENNRETNCYLNNLNTRLAIFQQQLSNLGTLLREYKGGHGEYPSNNKGLLSLDTFGSWHQVYAGIIRRGDSYDIVGMRRLENDDELKRFIEEQRQKWKHPRPMPDFFVSIITEESNLSEYKEYTMGIRKDDIGFIWGPVGPIDRWSLMPYLYENRIGLEPSAFEGSVINKDVSQNYSMRVDDGIYVYSIAAMNEAQTCNQFESDIARRKIYILLIIFSSILIVVVILRKWLSVDGYVILKWIVFIIIINALLVFFLVSAKRKEPLKDNYIYANVSRIYVRTPELVNQQKEMLDLYRKNNVITQEAYDKQIAALELTPTIDVEAEK